MIRVMATRDRPLDRANRTATAMVAAAAEELRRARTNGGLSQRDVAQAAGVSHATVSRIERAASPEASLIVLAASPRSSASSPAFASIPTAIHSVTWLTFGCWSGFIAASTQICGGEPRCPC
jgi:DNA-binding XRE family transcriptional regulator